jgi:aryl-alcohol dehydrogenase-like predicted oxidoreductase
VIGNAPLLGLGTATFARGYGIAATPLEPSAAATLLREAMEAGVRYLDTAADYGDSERIVGATADLIVAHGVRVCTKIATRAAARPAELEGAVRASLQRLHLPRLDTLMLHSADCAALGTPTVAGSMEALRAAKLAERVGASTYGVDAARAACGAPWCGAVQLEFSILNQSVLRRLAGLTSGVEIVVRSVLCKGLLTDRRVDAPALTAEIADTLGALGRVATEWGGTLPELAIRFALDTPGIGVVLVGVSSREELATALRAQTRSPLPQELYARLVACDRSEAGVTHPERWSAGAMAGAR